MLLKKVLALSVLFCLILSTVAYAKGKPADTPGKGKGQSVEQKENGNSGNGHGKSDEAPGQIKKAENQDKRGDVKGKPEKPGEKGRLHAIEVKLAKWSRMPETALKGLWNSILNIGKKIGFVPEKPDENTQPPADTPDEP